MSQQNKELDKLLQDFAANAKPIIVKSERLVATWPLVSSDINEKALAVTEEWDNLKSQAIAAIEVLIDRAVIDKLYSLITPIWGDKNWDEDDKYVLNLKGSDILKHIKELEANLKSKGSKKPSKEQER